MSETLLLISQREEDQAFAQEVAQATRLRLTTARDAREGASIINSDDVSTILADGGDETSYRALEEAIQESVGLFSDKINANKFHFITSQLPERAQYLMQSPLFGHYVLRRFGSVRAAGQAYGQVVRRTLEKRAFGLAGLLQPGARIQKITLKTSNDKADAVEAILNYAVAAKYQSRMASAIATAADDFITYAIYDSPVDAVGKPKNVSLPRSSFVKLEGPNAAVDIEIGFDGKQLGFAVTDRYGSLDKMKALTSIARNHLDEELKLKPNVHSSIGLGLAQAVRFGGSVSLVSEAHGLTEVAALFGRTLSFAEFRKQFRFVSTQFYF